MGLISDLGILVVTTGLILGDILNDIFKYIIVFLILSYAMIEYLRRKLINYIEIIVENIDEETSKKIVTNLPNENNEIISEIKSTEEINPKSNENIIEKKEDETVSDLINEQNSDELEKIAAIRKKRKESLLTGRELHALKRGLLWQQRDRLFSRWKERYFILTRDYLHCFKRASSFPGAERISEMGQFIFKVKLAEVERVEWINRKSYSAIGLLLGRDGRVLLRSPSGLEDWFELLEECTLASKERRRQLRHSRPSLERDNNNINNINNNSIGGASVDAWLLARHKFPGLSDSVPELLQGSPLHSSSASAHGSGSLQTSGLRAVAEAKRRRFDSGESPRLELRTPIRHLQHQRLSLLSDLDLCVTTRVPSVPSVPGTFRGRPAPSPAYRLNSDVFFLAPADRLSAMVTPCGSFRHSQLPRGSIFNNNMHGDNNLSPYRDRSLSCSGKQRRGGPSSLLATQV